MRYSLRLTGAFFASFVLLTGAVALEPAASAPALTKIVVPKGTPIVVETYNAINSATFKAGEHLAYTVTSDVIVNGNVVAKAGDRATGVVLDAVQGHKATAGKAGMLLGPVGAVAGATANKAASKGGDLRVSVRKVKSFCGDSIAVSFVRSEYHPAKRFHKMTTVEIAKGQQYVTTVAHDTTVCGTPTNRAPAAIPAGALHADGG